MNLDNYEANYADQYFDPMGAYDSGPLRMFLYEDNVFLAIGKGFFNPLGYGPATVKKQYAAGRGLVKHEEAHALNTNQSESRTYNLIGAIINGVTYGSIQTDSIYFKPQIVPVPELTVEVYPNPLRDELKIKTNNNDQLEIILYDILSKKILQQTFTGSASFNTEQLLPGTYIFEIKKNEGVVQRGKIVRE